MSRLGGSLDLDLGICEIVHAVRIDFVPDARLVGKECTDAFE